MREFRRISFTSSELTDALAQKGHLPNHESAKFDLDLIRSKRVNGDFVFEFRSRHAAKSTEAPIELPCETVLGALIEHSIQCHIPMPRRANKDVRLIFGKLCLDTFLGTVESLSHVPTSREFRRIIFSNAELKSALEAHSRQIRRRLSHYEINGVKTILKDKGIQFELDLSDYKPYSNWTLQIEQPDALAAMVNYTIKVGVILPREANKLAAEFHGHLNIDLTM